ncbi:hypothetical protein GH714_017483 [Hevea brasiliensis]|uniref:Selenoprotein T n=1 Tax=Hevea brasiliensis TaxID=3981 RepID=A0A6A6LZD9_HEVBR|nr:hypothetical protein GH714_017483 [Hevea brasiliensis]
MILAASDPSPIQFSTNSPFNFRSGSKSSSSAIGGVGGGVGNIGFGSTINIDFCASCSYRGTAVTMQNMLETQFPGINVILANYPPSFPKRLLSKVVPVFQFGIIGVIMAGEQIFPRLGFAVPPPWYYSLRANRFGSIASTWLFGNFIQSFSRVLVLLKYIAMVNWCLLVWITCIDACDMVLSLRLSYGSKD